MDTESQVTMLSPRGKAQAEKLPQYLITLSATMCVFSAGNALAWTAPVLPMLTSANSILPVTPEQGSWVGSLLPIGALIGALPAGSCADVVGRKRMILALGAPLLISWVMILAANSVYILYVARLLVGVAIGAICAVVPMYISEIAEAKIRGTLCSYFQLMIVMGVLYTYIMGAFCSFKVLSIVCGIIPILFLIAFFRAPETPVYLLRKGKRAEAEVALLKLRGSKYDIHMEMNALTTEIVKETKIKVSFSEAIRKKESIKALIICLSLMAFQQLSGINVVVFYSESIFIDAGSSLNPRLATIAVGIAQVLSSYMSSVLVDRAGRKILLLTSGAIMGVCLGVLGWFFHMKESNIDVSNFGIVPIIAVVSYISTFAVGFGPVPWLMTGELFPSEVKGMASGLAVALNWSLAFIVTKTFQDMALAIGLGGTFWLFTTFCVFATAFVAFYVIETKGKSLSEIQDELKGIKTISDSNNNNNNNNEKSFETPIVG